MRCAGTLPSIKKVRGRSPRPICVMTSSTCRHGAIHLRHTLKAMPHNAMQIRRNMSQDTAFYSLRTWVVLQNDTSKRREDVSQSQTTSLKFSLGQIPVGSV